MAGYGKEGLIWPPLVWSPFKPCWAPGRHTVAKCSALYIFPELHWDSLSVHHCVCFLLTWAHIWTSERQGYATAPATWINCHLLLVNGRVKNGEAPIVGAHWYAERCGIETRTLDEIRCIFTPDQWGAFFSVSPSELLLSQKQLGDHRSPPMPGTWRTKTPPSTLWTKPTLICFLMKKNHVSKGTQRPILCKRFTCRAFRSGTEDSHCGATTRDDQRQANLKLVLLRKICRCFYSEKKHLQPSC